MTPHYAAETSVSPEKSRAEIETTLRRYGADGFLSGWDDQDGRAFIQFRVSERVIRIVLPLPRLEQVPTRDARQRPLTPKHRADRLEQLTRQRWRALALVTKAKLEAIASGVATFDQEFLPYIVLPDGTTVGDAVLPQVADAYLGGGSRLRLLPAAK